MYIVLDSVFSRIFLTLQAQQTVAAIKNDKIEGSNESLNYQQQTPSFSQLQETDSIPFGAEAGLSQTHKRSRSNDLQDYFSSSSVFEANSNTLQASASSPALANHFGFLNSVKKITRQNTKCSTRFGIFTNFIYFTGQCFISIFLNS